MSVLVFLLISYLLTCVALMPLFKKAGVDATKALIPGVNFIEWCKLIGRTPTFALWLLFPIVNIFVWCGMAVDLVRSFGKHDFGSEALSVIYAPLAFFLTNRSGNKYGGPVLEQEKAFHQQLAEAETNKDTRAVEKLVAANPYKKGPIREWTEAIVFAVFAAAFIRMFLIEAYVIPTSSMEGSLLVGDFLFVSKAHYGIRTPMTVVQLPLIHNRMPVGKSESYLKKPSLDYYRLPALENIDRMEPVVFNFPEGDSVFVTPERTFSMNDIAGLERIPNPNAKARAAQIRKVGLTTRPVDKKDHYIKRCVGLPGDSLKIVNGQLWVNGQMASNPTNMQFTYQVKMPNSGRLNFKFLEDIGVNIHDAGREEAAMGIFNLNQSQVEKIRALGQGVTVDVNPPKPYHDYNIFPKDPAHFPGQTMDNFGPIYIPKAGATVKISPENVAYYSRIIHHYEGNDLKVSGGKVLINGAEAGEYTFKQNYFWMMGDNRHNSEDSRVWGYVPEDHVVGKPLFVWFSVRGPETYANGKGPGFFSRIRWNRLFNGATIP